MKLKYSALLMVLNLLLGFSALAANNEPATEFKKTEYVSADSSAKNRNNKEYLVTTQLAGFAVSPIPAFGLNGGVYLTPDSILQVELSTGSLPFLFFSLNATTAGVNYKHFFGNSFYTKVGADYRQISISNVYLSYFNSTDTLGSANSIVGNLAIGNQWQWENFTLGCDWIGINPPVIILDSKFETAGLNAADERELRNSWDTLAKVTSWQLLRFYIGASF